MKTINPWWKGFEGSITKVDDYNYEIRGNYQMKNNKLIITELPVGEWTSNYKEFLDKMLEDAQVVPSKSKTKDYDKKRKQKLRGYQKTPGGNPGTPVCWAIPDLHGMRGGVSTRSPPASAGGFLSLAQVMPNRIEPVSCPLPIFRAAPRGRPLPDVDSKRFVRIVNFDHVFPPHPAGCVAPVHLPDGGEHVAGPRRIVGTVQQRPGDRVFEDIAFAIGVLI
jgi:hypothetical protein